MAAQTITMSSRFSSKDMGNSCLTNRNVFKRLIACSTKMRRLAIVLVFFTPAFVNCQLQYLHKAASLIVDKFVFDDHSVNGLLDQILTAQQTQDASDIVTNLDKLVNIDLDKKDISISHRLKAQQSSSRDTRFPSRPPSIIVKFVRREDRDRLYRARNRLKNFSTKDLNLGRLSDNKIFISESLTQRNRELFNSALKLKKDLGYRFIWSFYGRIFLRRDADSPAVPISSDKDLENIKRRHSSTSSSR